MQARADLDHYIIEHALFPNAYPLPGHGNMEMDCLKREARRLLPELTLPTTAEETGT